jgi:hypothetical protein
MHHLPGICRAQVASTTTFNFESESGTSLHPRLVDMLEELRETTVQDADTFATLAMGKPIDSIAVQDRSAKRVALLQALLLQLGSGERTCGAALTWAQRHLSELRRDVASTLLQAEGTLATLHAHQQALQILPDTEKKARKLLRDLKRAEKRQGRAQFRLRACNNRLDETKDKQVISAVAEDGDSTSDEDDTDLLGLDWDIGSWTMEKLQAKIIEIELKLRENSAFTPHPFVQRYAVLHTRYAAQTPGSRT